MSQKCSECGRESPLGQTFQHYWGCVHDMSARTPLLSQMGRGQQQAQIDRLQPASHGAGVSE